MKTKVKQAAKKPVFTKAEKDFLAREGISEAKAAKMDRMHLSDLMEIDQVINSHKW